MSAANNPDLAAWLERVDPGAVFRSLAEAVPDAGVFAVDEARRLVHWSPGAERLLGYRAADVLGKDCLTTNRCHQCVGTCGLREYGTIDGIALRLYRSDGRPVRVRKFARVLRDERGEFAGGVEILVPDDDPPQGALDIVSPPTDEDERFGELVTADPAMRKVLQICRNVAETDTSVLVRGESGTGKELVARALHGHSARSSGPFVAVNCAALTPSLMESELFGHVRGAFTGATRDRPGIFRQADGGTLFLDEIAELPLEMQAKLLRVLEEREVVPVGSTRPVEVDVRVVSATHRSLRNAVASSEFREDLMFRLRVVPIFLPPLRERRADVQLLLRHFIGQKNLRGHRVVDRIAPEAQRALLDHRWPGNVRELRNVVEYAFAVGRGPELDCQDLPIEFRESPDDAPPSARSPRHAPNRECERIVAALEAEGGNIGRAAERLGMSRPTLWRKRKKYGL